MPSVSVSEPSLPALELKLEAIAAPHLTASGLQSFSHRDADLSVAGLGRLVFTDAEAQAIARTQGPGPALCALWRSHRERLLSLIGGEYALAIWSETDRQGMVAVDRFNTLSLFWGGRDGRIAVASAPGRVCELLGVAAELDPRALHAYVYFHMIPAPLSIHRGVNRLDHGQGLLLGRGEATPFTHWHARFEETRPHDETGQRAAFLAGLRAGVAECIAGVPRERLGCFLSGGTDSSTIAGLVTEAYQGPARTFSIGFDVSDYDERRYSRLAVARFGTEHTEHVLTPEEAEQAIDRIAVCYEQPFGNASAVPTLVCASIARAAGIGRLLGGDGGDELYGGNERYATQWLFSLYGAVPGLLRERVLEPLLFGPLAGVQAFPFGKARSYIEQARIALPDRLGARYNLLNRFGATRVFTDALLSGAGAFDPLALEREVYARSDAASQINRLLAYDFKFTLGDNDLPKVTRMCHAAGVEVAFPMLCGPVVDHSLALAPGQKLKGRKLRHFFRESLRGFLPDEIIDKPKHGFGMPFGDWVLAQPRLAARVGDALGSLESRGLLRPGFLREVDAALRGGHAGYFGTMMWVLLSLELWLRVHMPDARLSGASPAVVRRAEARE